MLQEKCKQNTNTVTKCKCTDKKEVASHYTGGEDFWCNTRSKTLLVKLLSQYLNEDGNKIVNIKDDADKHIGGAASVFESEKKMLLYFQKAHAYTVLYLLKKEIGEIFMKADSKKHETQKLVNIIKVVERSSRYLFYL